MFKMLRERIKFKRGGYNIINLLNRHQRAWAQDYLWGGHLLSWIEEYLWGGHLKSWMEEYLWGGPL